MTYDEVLAIEPLVAVPDVSVAIPGSKSITNRALLCAALANGRSTLRGALVADDTLAMIDGIRALGATVTHEGSGDLVVAGLDIRSDPSPIDVDARKSGTTSRFLLPAAAGRPGRTVVDGDVQLRGRPFGPLVAALREIGAQVEELGEPGRLPLAVTGAAHGGRIELPGHLSSQFLSGLLMAAPLLRDGLRIDLTSPLVSVPYVTMTVAVMRDFGVDATPAGAGPADYVPTSYQVEPDASAASYFFGAAAITGGRVTVAGLGTGSIQGDVAFVDVLERMGAEVIRTPESITVRGTGTLHGVDVDMSQISDTAQTLAAVAVFADGPTTVRGIGFIRAKETDRITAIVTELRRAGIDVTEGDDGFTIHPGTPRPTTFATYDDHRMAMSLALLGLCVPGISIADPDCVAKTYPQYFDDLDQLR